jgi:hypothetical protein
MVFIVKAIFISNNVINVVNVIYVIMVILGINQPIDITDAPN